jgi:two-component system sporulation sensor kinase C
MKTKGSTERWPRRGQSIAPEHFRAIAEGTVDWESWLSPEGEVLWINEAVERFTGYTPAECLAMDDYPLLLVVAEDRDRIQGHLQDASMGSSGNNIEFRVLHRNGTTPWVAMSWQPMVDQNVENLGFRTSIRDITEKHAMREQLRLQNEHLEQIVQERTARIAQLEEHRLKMEQLAAIGELAAGVAHEINNPLAGIRNAFALLKKHLPKDAKHYDKLELIDQEIERISGITHQMYQLYRPSEQVSTTFSLDETERHVLSLTLPIARKSGVSVDWQTAPFPPSRRLGPNEVHLRSGELKQILINLIHNALQASNNGDRVEVLIQPLRDRLRIEVRDSGCGVPEELQEKIFFPFFSTKVGKVGQGMGLGLSVTKGLVEGMRGEIRLNSAVNKGSVFIVDLPRDVRDLF